MSALPPSLSVSLKKFQVSSHSVQRVIAPSTSYLGGSSIILNLPRTGVIDLQSLSLLATINVTGTGTIKTLPFHSQLFRKVSVFVGGNQLSLSQLSDYGFVYGLTRQYGANKTYNDFQQTILKAGNVTLTTATDASIVLAVDFLGFLSGKHLRYLPLDIMPEMYIQVDLKPLSSWVTATTATAGTLSDVRLIYTRIDMENNLLNSLYADRISKQSIQIPYEDIRYIEGGQVTASASTVTVTVNSQSVDYIMGTHRPDYSAGLTTALYLANNGGSGNTNQMFWNGVPLSGWSLTVEDSLCATMGALNASGNMLFAPDFSVDGAVSASGNDYRDSYFANFHRLKFDTESMDGSGWVTGINTFGAGAVVDMVTSGSTSTTRRPVLVIYSTGIMELGQGKQVLVTL